MYIGLILLILGMMLGAFALKQRILMLIAAFAWIIWGVFNYTQSSQVWDVEFASAFFGFFMMIVCFLLYGTVLETKEEDATYVKDLGDMEIEEDEQKQMDAMRQRATMKGRRKRGQANRFKRERKEGNIE